jgi:hypothetical protein
MPLTQEQQISDLYSKVDMLVTAMQKLPAIVKRATLEAVYPVGSPFVSKTDSRNPSEILGFGTWAALEGVVLVGHKAGDENFGTVGATVGTSAETISINQVPSHRHKLIHMADSATGAFERFNYFAQKGTQAWTTATAPDQDVNKTDFEGGGQPHNNIQPSKVVYMWERTA